MNETDERITAAAKELSAALTAGRKDYWVTAHGIEITNADSPCREWAWTVHVTEASQRDIAP